MSRWLQRVAECCKSQLSDYLPHIFTDITYDEAEHDLQRILDATAVRRHAAADVVIVYDGADWKDKTDMDIIDM